jgi:hypothetical protein
MENIYVLPTTKLSRLHYYYYCDGQPTYGLSPTNLPWRDGRCLYITSDESKKLKDYVYDIQNKIIYRIDNYSELESAQNKQYKKIILTTDLELITNGIQAIDDEFLQWFVKNPSCDFAEAVKVPYFDESGFSYLLGIPQEKPTKEEVEKRWNSLIGAGLDEPLRSWNEPQLPKSEIDWSRFPQSTKDAVGYVESDELKQETLKEAAEMYNEEDMVEFAKWLSKLSFNVQHFDENGLKPFNELLSIWKKQFKNK